MLGQTSAPAEQVEPTAEKFEAAELCQERRLTAVVSRQDSRLKSLDDFKSHLADLFERFESREWPPVPVWEKYVRGAFGVVIKFQVASGRNIVVKTGARASPRFGKTGALLVSPKDQRGPLIMTGPGRPQAHLLAP